MKKILAMVVAMVMVLGMVGCGKSEAPTQSTEKNAPTNVTIIDNTKVEPETEDVTETEEKEYEIVVANILADVIIPMAPVIPDRLKKGGYFITSGIIDFKENEVKEAIEKAGLTVVEINHQGEWVNITAQKN